LPTLPAAACFAVHQPAADDSAEATGAIYAVAIYFATTLRLMPPADELFRR